MAEFTLSSPKYSGIIDIWEQWYDEEGNYSNVRVQVYCRRNSTAAYWGSDYNARKWSVGGPMGNSGQSAYDYRGSALQLLADYSWNIGHNPDGTGSVPWSCWIWHNNTPPGEGSTGGSIGLTSLYRWADPTYVEANTITDVSFKWRVDTNRLCDALAVSLDGGAWNYYVGDFWSYTMQLGSPTNPLISGKTYSVRISLRRKASGFWKEAGNWNVTTATQNNFFDIDDF